MPGNNGCCCGRRKAGIRRKLRKQRGSPIAPGVQQFPARGGAGEWKRNWNVLDQQELIVPRQRDQRLDNPADSRPATSRRARACADAGSAPPIRHAVPWAAAHRRHRRRQRDASPSYPSAAQPYCPARAAALTGSRLAIAATVNCGCRARAGSSERVAMPAQPSTPIRIRFIDSPTPTTGCAPGC